MRPFYRSGTLFLCTALALSACQTVPEEKTQNPGPIVETQPGQSETTPDLSKPQGSSQIGASGAEELSPPKTETNTSLTQTETPDQNIPPLTPRPENTILVSAAFEQISGWESADLTAALKAFQRGCTKLVAKDDMEKLGGSYTDFGTIADWRVPCNRAMATPAL